MCVYDSVVVREETSRLRGASLVYSLTFNFNKLKDIFSNYVSRKECVI